LANEPFLANGAFDPTRTSKSAIDMMSYHAVKCKSGPAFWAFEGLQAKVDAVYVRVHGVR
jgi:hypothetical protein